MIIDDELGGICENAAVSCSQAWESRIDVADERWIAISRARHICYVLATRTREPAFSLTSPSRVAIVSSLWPRVLYDHSLCVSCTADGDTG
jgi:hypothetical protein